MNKLSKRYNDWRLRREQLALARWAQERAKGKLRVVLHQAFFYTVLMTGVRDAIDQFYGGDIRHGLVYYLIVNGITGIFVGYVSWWSQEAKYKKAFKS